MVIVMLWRSNLNQAPRQVPSLITKMPLENQTKDIKRKVNHNLSRGNFKKLTLFFKLQSISILAILSQKC